jgi:hypothetical protein
VTLSSPVNLRCLAAISQCASSDDPVRYYSHGVLIEIAKSHTTYVATDGYILAAVRLDLGEGGGGELTGAWIIPTAVCRYFKFKQGGMAPVATLSCEADARTLSLSYNGVSHQFEPINDTFPDWRRYVPSGGGDGTVAQFDPNLVMRLARVGHILAGGPPGARDVGKVLSIDHNGDGPAIVGWGPEVAGAFGIIMPFRAAAPTVPKWFSHQEE